MSPKSVSLLSMSAGLLLSAWTISSSAGTISILCAMNEACGQSEGITNDGTIFRAAANPTEPATGTGVFEPFVRIQSHNNLLQSGYNTDANEPDINFNTKTGLWTHSVKLGDLGVVEYNGISYFQFQLDANETGRSDSLQNQIKITDVQIYIGGEELRLPENYGGYTGDPFDSSNNSIAGYSPVWVLDGTANGDVDVLLQASICDSNGQCGSGHGDMDMFVRADYLQGDLDDYFVFYTEYSGAHSGFEEWRYMAANDPRTNVPEPTSIMVLGLGLLGLAGLQRKFRRA